MTILWIYLAVGTLLSGVIIGLTDMRLDDRIPFTTLCIFGWPLVLLWYVGKHVGRWLYESAHL